MNHKSSGNYFLRISNRIGTVVSKENDVDNVSLSESMLQDIFKNLKIRKGYDSLNQFFQIELNNIVVNSDSKCHTFYPREIINEAKLEKRTL
jgi:hypothetical protein